MRTTRDESHSTPNPADEQLRDRIQNTKRITLADIDRMSELMTTNPMALPDMFSPPQPEVAP